METKKANYSVRATILFSPLFIVLFVLFSVKVGRDFFTNLNGYKSKKGIIQNVFKNKYVVHSIRFGDIWHDCLDIKLKERKFFIRLTAMDEENYWQEIADSNNINKSIELLYIPHTFQDTILFNPAQLSIGNQLIYSYKKTKALSGGVLLLMIAGVSLFIYWLFSAIKKYKQTLLEIDREIAKKSVWKLIWTWLLG